MLKKLYRFQTRYFKSNNQIKQTHGIFVYRLNNKQEYTVDIISVSKNDFKNQNERYSYYQQYIQEKDSQYILVEYFEVNDECGLDADVIYQLTKQQLLNFKNDKIQKLNKDNVRNLQNKI